jgi:5-methyltetrahydropteroyltriglutamate--homocysteine methyltransferase
MIVDDIGSFPLPRDIKREDFAKEYPGVLEEYAKTGEVGVDSLFYKAVASSLKFKIESGIEVINYPQHYDMHRQFMEPIEKYQTEPFQIDEKYAVIPEVYVVEREAEKYFEETGEQLKLKVCATGAIELYTKTSFGYHVYDEILMNIAKSVNAFLQNSMLDTKHVKTSVVAIDEPSLGFIDLLNVEDETLIKALDESVKSLDATVQIHLHTPKASKLPFATENIDVLTGEFAGNPKNMDFISRKELDAHDKFIRAGITRTDVDHIFAAYFDGEVKPKDEDLVDSVDAIKKIYNRAEERFGDRMTFAGPDCGIGAWPSQEVASLLLKRTVEAVK